MAEAASVLTGGEGEQQQQQQSANADHWSATLPEDLRPWAAGMGLDKLDERGALTKVLPMYRGAEQKLGVPADQVLRLPGKDAKPEDWKAVWQKLGAPEKPEGYEFPEELKDDKIAASFRTKAHELGLPAGAAKTLVEWFSSESAAAREAQEALFDQQAEKDIGELKAAWGEDFDKNIDLAKRVARTMGINEQEARALERTLGIKRTAEVFSKFGGALGEHRFVGGQEGAGVGMSPAAAKEKIDALRKDSEWMAKYIKGDVEKAAEFKRLHEIAHGTDPVGDLSVAA